MKRLCITFVTLAIIILLSVSLAVKPDNGYLRIHIRANSNGVTDQNVKYEVRDEIVRYLTPLVAECKTKADAMKTVEENLQNISAAADNALKANGFCYGAKAALKSEEFPTRVYDGITFEHGVYDALIVYLGSGEGDNWWCVIYPPLCFTGEGTAYVYKSKIREIIDNFFS